jgi:phosphoglucosamine mutase
MRAAETTLGQRGRVLVRYSGTEPLLRVMVEGEREAQIRDLAECIAAAARDALGAGESTARRA